MSVERLAIGWIDYSIFFGLLSVSLLIGIYFGFFSKQDSSIEYLFGGKSMNYFAVSISILASFLSGITFLGVPTEVYQHGSQYWAVVISAQLIAIVSINVTMPVFFKLQVTSVYEYLGMRFSKSVETFASVLGVIALFIFMPIVVFVPAIAFSQVTGHNVHTITPIFCLICIIYTSMGGVKAVVWTDSIQFVFTIGGLLTIIILGVKSIGGISEIWRIADKGKRITFFDMDPSFTRRETFWAQIIGLTSLFLSRLGLGQKFVQRYLAIRKESDMKKAIRLTSHGWGIIQIACIFLGLMMYTKYHDCDPLTAKLIDRYDQTLPYYVMDIAGNIPGLPGLFLAGLASSALATKSASLNTLSGIIYDTCFKQRIPETIDKEVKAARIMKILTVIIGVIVIGLIFIIERLGTIFEMALGLASAVEGPLLGLFMLGMLVPWVGSKGALTGGSVSFAITSWLILGQQWYISQKKIIYPNLPMSLEGCIHQINETLLTTSITSSKLMENFFFSNNTLGESIPMIQEEKPLIIYSISVLYFTFVSSIIVIVVGVITSYFAGEMDLSRVNLDHISPIIHRFLPKEKFYTGVPVREFEMTDINKSTSYNNQ